MASGLALISVPFHVGVRGEQVGGGPLALIDAGLLDRLRQLDPTCTMTEIEPVDEFEGEIGRSFELLRRVSRRVSEARSQRRFPVVLAGNCMTTVAVFAGLERRDTGVLWFDAHPDYDTPDEHRSGYLDAMGAAMLTGQGWHTLLATVPGFVPMPPERLVYCGVRDFEIGQREKLVRDGIAACMGSTTGATDYPAVLQRVLHRANLRHALVHVDLDALDPSIGMANRFAAPGGLSAAQLASCLDIACAAFEPVALTLASFDPSCPGAENLVAPAGDAAVRVAQHALASGSHRR